ncbi:hypothetical protein GCM10009775_03480 [Microbacterium aoyamense]|uniref:DUF2510 domain-containing protein n=1 Tax=Microbacterium aoyamense TaxID=344166 RepID=A0ABN2P6U5_9MICO|nr:DUF2510 domain-containing protein [Microbacterium aoyamense]
MSTSAEAGWYDDGTGKQRWWDGSRWTEHYVDFRERDLELHTDAAAPSVGSGTVAGWYDDGRGRERWWDGARWTERTRFSGEERTLAGIVVDGKWIHFGMLSQPVAGARASVESGVDLLRRGRLEKPAVARVLYGPRGQITPHQLKRSVDPLAVHIVVEVADQTWLTYVATGQDAEARTFASWISSVGDHYRYR